MLPIPTSGFRSRRVRMVQLTNKRLVIKYPIIPLKCTLTNLGVSWALFDPERGPDSNTVQKHLFLLHFIRYFFAHNPESDLHLWVNILASFYPEHPLKVRPKSVSSTLYYGILVTFIGAPFVNRRYTKGVPFISVANPGEEPRGARASPLYLRVWMGGWTSPYI